MSKEFRMPDVPNVFNGNFPDGYRPWAKGWSVQKENLLEKLEDGTFKMSQLDISIPPEEFARQVNEGINPDDPLSKKDLQTINERYRKLYQQLACGVGCNHCFDCKTELKGLLLHTHEIYKIIKEAKEIGVKNVKFLGPGEFLHNRDIFDILNFFKEQGIHFSIFTKGVILGNDDLAKEKHGMTAKEFAKKLSEYENITILFGITSADEATENTRCTSRLFPNLFNERNTGFENLVELGLNKDPNNQRLALVCSPVLNDNIDEVLKLYEWALERNIPTLAPPTMISGKGLKMAEIKDEVFKNEKLVDMFIDIYTMLIRKKILTVAMIEEEGIAPYPGYACNQFIDGMLIRPDGRVQACPGNEAFAYAPDVRKEPLKEIWKRSLGHKLRKELVKSGKVTITQPCYAKTEELIKINDKPVVAKGCGSIPNNFFEKVMEGIKKKIAEIV